MIMQIQNVECLFDIFGIETEISIEKERKRKKKLWTLALRKFILSFIEDIPLR